MKNKVAVFLAHYGIGNSPSILNLLYALSRRYRVHLYIDHVALVSLPESIDKRAVKIIAKNSLVSRALARFNEYRAVIAIDPHGFYLYDKTLGKKDNCFYYSLELYLKNDHFGLDYPTEVEECERQNIHTIKGLIIQSCEKETLFREDYGLPVGIRGFILPITGRGPAVADKSDFLRKKYAIPEGKKIALHLGGIAQWFSCIEIAEEFSRMTDWVLFFQGYPDQTYLLEFKKMLKEKGIDNVILSDVYYNSPDELSETLRSCNIGIAWYNDISIGFRVAGRSSGKITSYLRYGLPIVSKRYESTVAAVEKTGCGKCIQQIWELPQAVGEIMADYDTYAKNCLEEYDRTYNFETYEDGLIAFLEGKDGQTAC